MRNVTITLDDQTIAWARARAAARNMSLSRFVGEVLHQRMRESAEYERSMQRYLARKPVRLRKRGARYPRRDELHER
jgi:hypothetical protein